MTLLPTAAGYGAGIVAEVVYDIASGGPINEFIKERLKNAGPEIDKLIAEVLQDAAEISGTLKEVIKAWLEGYIEKPDEFSFQQIEFQKQMNKALLPQDFGEIVERWIFPTSPEIGDWVKELEDFIENLKEDHLLKDLAHNRTDGNRRESEFREWLEKQYGVNDGYIIEDEIYLRDKDGNIVRDPVTGEARRVDFVVIEDGKVIKSYEVTSLTAPKEDQMAKENRLREIGGDYMKDGVTGKLLQFDDNVTTEVVRLT